MARSRVRPRLAAGALVAAAVLLLSAGVAQAGSDLRPYRGLGTWIDIYKPQAWQQPRATIAAVAARGVSTLFLETGNYRQRTDLVRPAGLGRLLEEAHAAGLRVVAWYLPSLVHPARDLRRSLAAIRFRSRTGQQFDSFALDIESSLVRPASRRTARLLSLSRQLRDAVGPSYRLGAIIPSPRGMELRPSYWPGFPFERLAALYDVFVPMAYYTYHVRGRAAVRFDVGRSVRLIREQTGDPRVPIHVIGGIAGESRLPDVRGFLDAVAACRPHGYSLYEWYGTPPAVWSLLAVPPQATQAACG